MADQETLSLKVLVEKKKNRVVLAEADNDFIDMLFSFLTLPMGTIVRLVRKQSPMEEIGCMNKIYESVENCEVRALRTEACKTMLLWPKNVAEAQCGTLKFKMDDREPDKFYLCTENHTESRFTSHYKNVLCKCGRVMDNEISGSVGVKDEDGRVFAKETARFMLSDDLHVMPVSISTSFSLLQKLGIDDQSTLEKRTLNLGVDEVLHLLKCSLLSKTPLSDLVFRDGPLHGFCNVKLEPRTTIHSSNQSETATEREKIAVKLMISTSKQMALFAEVGEDFVDLLFSFLTFPLGSVVELLGGSCSMGCIDSLYQSVKDLDVDRYIKSEERKGMLVSPKLAPDFGYDNQPLHLQQAKHPSYESGGIEVTVVDPKSNSRETTSGSGFVKRSTMFMVTDDLVVTPVSPISSLFLLNRMEVLLCDVEERLLKLGEGEVLTLLKASLISKTVLTALFTSMKPKEEEYDSDPAHVSYQTKPKQEPLFY